MIVIFSGIQQVISGRAATTDIIARRGAAGRVFLRQARPMSRTGKPK